VQESRNLGAIGGGVEIQLALAIPGVGSGRLRRPWSRIAGKSCRQIARGESALPERRIRSPVQLSGERAPSATELLVLGHPPSSGASPGACTVTLALGVQKIKYPFATLWAQCRGSTPYRTAPALTPRPHLDAGRAGDY
jgi:hypothetical protein